LYDRPNLTFPVSYSVDRIDSESAATLDHAFVTSRVDQCNAVLSGVTKSVTDTLQRVMNAAARVVSETRKFDHGLTQTLHDDLHWLDVADRVTYKLGVIMHRRRHGKAPQYLVDCCTPVTDVVGRQRLRSASATTSAIHCWPPSIRCARPHGLESLPDDLRAQQDYESFRQRLKPGCSLATSVLSALATS